ncbi:MAG: cytochrome b/b6 domain-containing protein [Nitrospiria bacterium]
MKYDRVIRWLHASLALFIVTQLLSSLVMQVPKPGRDQILTALGLASFQVHRFTGMGVLLILFFHWFWALAGHLPDGFGHLFPWTDKMRMKKVIEDLRLLLHFKIRDFPVKNEFAGAVHGLGLLVASLMVITGICLFYGINSDGAMTHSVHSIKKVHQFIANLMWAYLIGHVSMGILHQWIGHRLLSDMFNLIRKSPSV